MKKPIIVCIDDEPTVLSSLKRELKTVLGDAVEIETALGGIDALELIEELIEEGSNIALVIVDYIMPDLKGDEVLKRIHDVLPDTLKIMLTGQATIEGVTNAINSAKLYRYIAKPWQREDLSLTVKQALKSYEQQHQLTEQNAKLRANESRLKQFIEAMPIGVAVHDITGEMSYANSKAKQLLGISELPEAKKADLAAAYQIYRAGTGELYPTSELPIVQSLSGKTVRLDDIELHQQTQIIPVEISTTPILDETGKITYAIASFQDISERKQAESDRLRLAQEQEAKNVALRMNQEIEAKNQELFAALQQLKTTQNQLIESAKMAALGQLIASIAHEINTPLGAINSSISNISYFLHQTIEDLITLSQNLSLEEGQLFSELIRRSLQEEGIISSREARQYKKALRQQLENLEIESAYTIADTLVTMGIYQEIDAFQSLLTKQDCVEILKVASNLSGLNRGINTINIATNRASKVVVALKTYAHHDKSTKKTIANLTDGIETVLTLYQSQLRQGVEVLKKYHSLSPILCYADELNQVWTNLIDNALQAMNHHGILTIEVMTLDQQAKISISDNGQGIPPENQAKIFVPFFTTKPIGEGSGLGLDIVKKIIDKHNGKITVESQPGQTTFSVFLPIELSELDTA
jgi:signal transduction histidine kinase/FixJ family two-component response regulator